MARASGSGLTSRSRSPHGSTSGMLVQHVRGSPAHVTLSESWAQSTTAARLRPPQVTPSVVFPAEENAPVQFPSVVDTSVSLPPSFGTAPVFFPATGDSFTGTPAGNTAAHCSLRRGSTAAGNASVRTTSVGKHVRVEHGRVDNGRDYHGREKHGRDTAQNFSQEDFAFHAHGDDSHVRVNHGRDYHAREYHGRGTAENFSRENFLSERYGRSAAGHARGSTLRLDRDGLTFSDQGLAEEEDSVIFSDTDQKPDIRSPLVLARADQGASSSFRLDLPEEQDQEDSTPASENEILRKGLIAVAELSPKLVSRITTLPMAGFCEAAPVEAYRFAPHPNVETWMNQHWNGMRNMLSLGGYPWTPEFCPVADWPQPANTLPVNKLHSLLLVDSPTAPPPAGPSASEAQLLIKPEKLVIFNKQSRALNRVEAHVQTAVNALASASSLASAMNLALRDPANPSRLSPTPDPDAILAIMDALPLALFSLSKGLTAAKISAAVANRDEFLALSEVPKAMAEKLRVVPLCKGSMFGPYLKASQEAAPVLPPASAEDIGLAMARALESGQRQKHWGGARSEQPQPRGRGAQQAPGRGRPQRRKGKGRGQPKGQNPPPPPSQGN